jgi:hypothetical protein
MKTRQYIPPLGIGTLTLLLLGLCLLTACTSGTPNSMQTPTSTPTPTPQSIYELATSKSPFLANSLSNNSNALYPWREGTDKIGTCLFKGGAYYNIEPTPGSIHACSPGGVYLRDFVFQVQMTIVKGDAGGIAIRVNSKGGYNFLIRQDGFYELSQLGVDYTIIAGGSSSAIKVGLNQTNLIAIVAHGNTFDLFVNKHYITSVNDSTYIEGAIGTVARAISKPTEVEFRNAMVWIL